MINGAYGLGIELYVLFASSVLQNFQLDLFEHVHRAVPFYSGLGF